MKKNKLHNVKSPGFITPENYFDSFDDEFFELLNEEKTLKSIKDLGFKVPKNYFENLDATILNKTNVKDTPVIKLSSKKNFYYVAGIAASLVLFIAIFFNKKIAEESLSVEMVQTYFENRDLSSYELAELLSETDLLEDDFTIAIPPYKEEHIESYLLDNTDIESILDY